MRVWTITQSGSPPRMRGKGLSDDGHFVAYRITPAYAGKSFRFFILEGLKEDHPRICGEKCDPAQHNVVPVGSPPHMRGKGTEIVHNIWAAGITPAYAGKRPRCAVISAFPRDHPRICGEKPTEDDAAALPLGSPPHMRGKVIVRAAGGPCPGITPAYAGKSFADHFVRH